MNLTDIINVNVLDVRICYSIMPEMTDRIWMNSTEILWNSK